LILIIKGWNLTGRKKKCCPDCKSVGIYYRTREHNYRCIHCGKVFKVPGEKVIKATVIKLVKDRTKRKCARCGKSKSIDEYYTSQNGYIDSYCKLCRKEMRK
jgi:ribosomal protein S27E